MAVYLDELSRLSHAYIIETTSRVSSSPRYIHRIFSSVKHISRDTFTDSQSSVLDSYLKYSSTITMPMLMPCTLPIFMHRSHDIARSKFARRTQWSATDIRLRLLIDDQRRSFRQRLNRLTFDSRHEILTCRDVVDQADDLACGPDLRRVSDAIKGYAVSSTAGKKKRESKNLHHTRDRRSKTPRVHASPKHTPPRPRTRPFCSPSPP